MGNSEYPDKYNSTDKSGSIHIEGDIHRVSSIIVDAKNISMIRVTLIIGNGFIEKDYIGGTIP